MCMCSLKINEPRKTEAELEKLLPIVESETENIGVKNNKNGCAKNSAVFVTRKLSGEYKIV